MEFNFHSCLITQGPVIKCIKDFTVYIFVKCHSILHLVLSKLCVMLIRLKTSRTCKEKFVQTLGLLHLANTWTNSLKQCNQPHH